MSRASAPVTTQARRSRRVVSKAQAEVAAGRLLAAHRIAHEEQLLCLRHSEQPRQPLGAARAGDDAEIYFRAADGGVVRRNPEIARKGKLASAAQCIAFDGRNHEFGASPQNCKNMLGAQPGVIRGRHRLHFGNIGAAHKDAVGAGKDDGSHRLIRHELFNLRGE